MLDISGNMMRTRLRSVVQLIGEEVLGFTKEDIGLHSICAGGAMAMFLSGISEIIIQRVGRWSSFAFLEYIREQVKCFTTGGSSKMFQYENFHHLNEKESKKVLGNTKLLRAKGDCGDQLEISFSNMVLNKM